MDGIRLFESRGSGSIPGEGNSDKRDFVNPLIKIDPRGVTEAHDSAKVEDRVRLPARIFLEATPEPDGQATDCKPVEAGSIPAGVFMKWKTPPTIYQASD